MSSSNSSEMEDQLAMVFEGAMQEATNLQSDLIEHVWNKFH